jgi:hypothetical protein
MLPLKTTLQHILKIMPQGGVFLCYATENTRQRRLLERVEETFRQQGHAVTNVPMEQVV